MSSDLFSLLKAGETQQLICFPYLGGYANAFLSLANHLEKPIETWALTPPGHGGSDLPPLQDLPNLVNTCIQELKKIIKPNAVFFGHSMGAIVAYFTIQTLLATDDSSIKPRALILSACNPPSYFTEKRVSSFPDQEVMNQLKEYGGIPSQILEENSLIEYFLPVYRADFRILEHSARLDYKPLALPVYYFWGEEDRIVPLENVLKWHSYFSNDINCIPIEKAPHMFIETNVSEIAKHIGWIFEELDQPCLLDTIC